MGMQQNDKKTLAFEYEFSFSGTVSQGIWMCIKRVAQRRDWLALLTKLLQRVHSSDSTDRCFHWSERQQTKV